MEGQTVSHYRVLEKLGGGGMGVVYKAKDLHLDRFVALKFLPPELTRDEEAKQRFMQEAKAASALDHSNICTIHEIGETPDGQLFLAMAYYEGETLKKPIGRGPLNIDAALDIAIQIAQGLAAAHESRIVHRDIKPANVMFTRRGEVKVVDFGLAKLVGQTGPTRMGTAMGTVAYMSPEQTRGEQVDHRTDIWSLGVVLYEMVTGQLPFTGDHNVAVATAISQRGATPLTAVRTGVPMELERVVDRALSKKPEDRHQTAVDLLSELRRVKRESDSQLQPMTAEGPGRSVSRRAQIWYSAGAVAGLVLLAAILGYFVFPQRITEETVPRLTNPVQVTAAIGVEDNPAWSADGQTLAYQSDQSGNLDIWVTQVGGGQPVNRTADHSGTDQFPSWSPDGRQIAFWSDRDGGAYFVMPALGGIPRAVLTAAGMAEFGGQAPQWSSDGTELACVVQDDSGFFVEIVSLSTGESRRLPLPGVRSRFHLSWSPDGHAFAYADTVNLTPDLSQLWVLRISDGEAFPITDGRMNDWSPSWSPDGRTLYFVSNRGGSMDLWQQKMGEDATPEGPPRSVTAGIGMRTAVFSPDGKKLAYSRGRLVANLWRVPILEDRPAAWADAEQVTFDQAFIEQVDVSRDGERLLFDSDRAGNMDLWTMPAAGGEMQQLTTDPSPDWAPRWSRDETEIVFYTARSGNRDVGVMPVAGGPARQLTRHEATDYGPAWSPDERQIAFSSSRSGNLDIWVVQVDTGEARQVTVDPGDDRYPQWSADGQWLVFRSPRSGESRLWRVSAAGGDPEPLTDGPAYYSRWPPDGQVIYFTGVAERAGNVWRFSVEDGTEQPVTGLTGRRGALGPVALATDGEYLYFTWAEDLGDVWVMDVAEGGREAGR